MLRNLQSWSISENPNRPLSTREKGGFQQDESGFLGRVGGREGGVGVMQWSGIGLTEAHQPAPFTFPASFSDCALF